MVLKKYSRKTTKICILFLDYYIFRSSCSLKEQRTTNPFPLLTHSSSQLWALCPKALGLFQVDGGYSYSTFSGKSCFEFNETDFCLGIGIILRFFLSPTLACLLFCIFLACLVKAILLTASLVSCSCAYPGATFKHHLESVSSLSMIMLLLHADVCQVSSHKPVASLSGNCWFDQPSLRYFMERGQAQQLHRNRLLKHNVLSPQKKKCTPPLLTIDIHKQTFIYSSLVRVRSRPKRCLKWVVFVLSYHSSLWTHL